MSHCEGIAQVANVKRATVSESLRSLMTNEQPWTICSGRSWQMSKLLVFPERIAHLLFGLFALSLIRSFAHFFSKNKRFAQKTDEQITNPAEKAWNSKKGMKF